MNLESVNSQLKNFGVAFETGLSDDEILAVEEEIVVSKLLRISSRFFFHAPAEV